VFFRRGGSPLFSVLHETVNGAAQAAAPFVRERGRNHPTAEDAGMGTYFR
jgi:hypothetical protein